MPNNKNETVKKEKIVDESKLLDYEIYEGVVDVFVEQDEGRESASITVTMINWDLGDYALVVSEHGEYKLVSKEYVAYSYDAQSIPFQVFLESAKPYDWLEEINAIALTPDQMREILYAHGYVVKRDINLAELAKNLLVRGKIPVLRR